MEKLSHLFRHGHLPKWIHNLKNVTVEDKANHTSVFNFLGNYDNFTITTNENDTNITDLPIPVAVVPVPKTVFICVAIILILCCAVSLVVNVIILASACFMRTRINNTLYISLSLAAADTFSLFFFSLALFLNTLLPRFGFKVEAPCFLLLVEALRMGAIMTNMFHLAALAFNHYVGILLPLRMITRRSIQYGIMVLWTVPSSLLVLDMFLLEEDQDYKCDPYFLRRTKFRTKFSVPFFTTLVLMVFIYSHIYKLVCRHQTQPMDWGCRHRSSQVTKKAIVTTIMILGSTILGWMPPFTYFALFCEDCLLNDFWEQFKLTVEAFVLNVILQFLLIIKPATNFYIYAYRMKEIRGALRRMRRRMWTSLSRTPGGSTRYELTEVALCRVRSRTSTFRSKTCSLRLSSNNGQTHSFNSVPPDSTTLRRCQSSTSRYKSSLNPMCERQAESLISLNSKAPDSTPLLRCRSSTNRYKSSLTPV